MSLPPSVRKYAGVYGPNFTYWSFQGNNYQNGMKRPLFRGWLHGCVSVLLMMGILGVGCSVLLGLLPVCWWKMVFVLIGKLTSYWASANYHLHPVQNTQQEQSLLKFDLLAISVAIWASSSCFATSNEEWALLFCIMIVATILNWVLIEGEFRFVAWCHNMRLCVLFVYFCFTILVIGHNCKFTNPWIVGTSLYLVSIVISPPFYPKLPSAVWHQPEINNWHEDFHVLVGIGDCIFIIMGIQFLQDCV